MKKILSIAVVACACIAAIGCESKPTTTPTKPAGGTNTATVTKTVS